MLSLSGVSLSVSTEGGSIAFIHEMLSFVLLSARPKAMYRAVHQPAGRELSVYADLKPETLAAWSQCRTEVLCEFHPDSEEHLRFHLGRSQNQVLC